MRNEGYGSWVCLSVCLSGKSHHTYGASVRAAKAVTYSAGNEGHNICGDFSENAMFRSYDVIYTAKLLSLPSVHDVHRS